ncbi:9244_t:CDS:2 [Dentiscutata erythropus]|uniref:9244_t:CDS:1 n=1 Tax=Dentiscutata erythropus TaxID=1348616 RepID=A0A9N9GKD9_9GLOM|nr:9244_t:CDS:2 [Dentiscutata erythropus]
MEGKDFLLLIVKRVTEIVVKEKALTMLRMLMPRTFSPFLPGASEM